MDPSSIRLTETVKKGGCAAKLPAGELRKVLGNLKLPRPQELIVGTETLDDACLWDLGNGQLMVQTLDFFTPIVDEPYAFGQVAAANALSDVFAMGGRPKVALTILAFPSQVLPIEVLGPLMDGAVDVIARSGACLAGGHTIDDDTLKLGFSVTGFVAKDRAWKNAGAKPGDVLILTKALGTGTIASSIKTRTAQPEWINAAIQSMTTLNDTGDSLADVDVHAATDVTGFGLAGHALQMAEASGVSFDIDLNALPVIHGAVASLEKGTLNRAHHTNAAYAKSHVEYLRASDLLKWLTVDPQTSGGLLLAVDAKDAAKVLDRLKKSFPSTSVIGRVVPRRADVLVSFQG